MNIHRKITAFVCAGVMALSFSCVAYAEPYHSDSFPTEQGSPDRSGKQTSESHHASRKKRPDHHKSRNENTEETPVYRDNRIPGPSCDGYSSGRSHRPGSDRSSETQEPAYNDILPGEIFTGDLPADLPSWYYEDYPVAEPEALAPEFFAEAPTEESVIAEQIPDDAVLPAEAEKETPIQTESNISAETEQETAVQPEADAVMPTVDLNDEEAMQELFRAFLNWMRENYTISQ